MSVSKPKIFKLFFSNYLDRYHLADTESARKISEDARISEHKDPVNLVEYSAFQKAVEALKFLASSDAYFVELSDNETGYFDPYKGPQHFARVTLRELGFGDE